MGKKKLAAKVDELETRAEELRAEAQELRRAADLGGTEGADAADEAAGAVDPDLVEESSSGGGIKGLLALLAAFAAGFGVYLKRKREQELDEALWEEPRAL